MSSESTDTCLVCTHLRPDKLPKRGDSDTCDCMRCGTYSVVGSAEPLLKHLQQAQRAILSGWIRHQFEAGSIPTLNTANIERIVQFAAPSMKERARALLAYIVKHKKHSMYDGTDPALKAVVYENIEYGLQVVLRYLREQGLIEQPNEQRREIIGLTPQGYAYLEEVGMRNQASMQGFVAMSFDSSMAEAYELGFDKGIRAAGYQPMRLDQHEHEIGRASCRERV
jgi:hypothetical protein